MKSIGSILVTGAGGFIGRHIVDCLRRQTPVAEIVALDREGHENTEADCCVSCDLVKEHKSEIAEIILRHDVGAIVHCAGSVGSEFASLIRDNLIATTLLIETLSEIKPGLPFCHLGSSAEYKPLDMPKKTSEDTLEEPVGDYGRVKLQTTRAVLKAASKGDISGYVLRLFNPIGAGMAPITLVGQVCEFLRNDQDVDLHLGNLDSYRDFIDVRDVAKAVVLSLQQGEKLVGEVVNIGTGTARCRRLAIILEPGRNHPAISIVG